MRWAAIAIALVACKAPEAPVEAPPAPVLRLTAPWKLERGGEAPVLSAGNAKLYPSGARRSHGDTIPGLAIGDDRGPRFGLLGGAYAPLVGPIDSDQSYRVSAGGLPLVVSLIDASGQSAFDARVLDFDSAIGRVVITGSAVIWLAADRTELMAGYAGKPSFSTPFAAGDTPEVRVFRADRIDLDTKAYGRVTIETSCVRPRLLRPVPRGSTSVFGIMLGAPRAPDPFYDPSAAKLALEDVSCAATTSTVSFRWP